MHNEVGLEAKCLRHCEATGEISLTCKMLTLKQRAWDLLGCPGVVLMLLHDLDFHTRTALATFVAQRETTHWICSAVVLAEQKQVSLGN